jgi:cytochrome oxidase Cu insertion factor (SCO1/SenC/PrrC family)
MRTLAVIFSVSTLIALTGCKPNDLPVATDGADEILSCCEEGAPSLADAKKKALENPAKPKDAEPTEPTIIDPDKTPAAPVTKDGPAATKDEKAASKEVTSPADKIDPATIPGIAPPDERDALAVGFTLTDQDGKPYDLTTIRGKPTVVTFIFTRCPNPQMCPLQGVKMAALQKQLDKAGLADKVNLLLITFDPDYDTPERLKKWGETNGMKFTDHAKMLRPDRREFAEFKDEFGFRAFYTDGQLNHKTDLFLLDAQARVAAFYGGMWNDAKVWEEVQKLVAEVK